MRIHLVIPHQLARIRVQRHNRAGVQVIALAALAREDWIGIAGSEVIEVEFRIVGAGNPCLSGAVDSGLFAGPRLDSRLTLPGSGPPLPLKSPGLRITGFEEPRV